MSRGAKTGLLLTRRALRDIREIQQYSTQQWGRQAAKKYVDELEAGLARLQADPSLASSLPEFHSALQFYRINKHVLVCDVQPKSLVVLTVIHASMDIPHRLAELEPALAAEVEILHRKLRGRKGRK